MDVDGFASSRKVVGDVSEVEVHTLKDEVRGKRIELSVIGGLISERCLPVGDPVGATDALLGQEGGDEFGDGQVGQGHVMRQGPYL